MDRNKPSSSARGQKKMSAHMGGELFALGTKASRDDAKSKMLPMKNVPVSSTDRKREASTNIASASKRLRMSLKEGSDEASSSSSSHYDLWEQYAKECDPVQLIESTYAAIDQNDNEAIIQLICGTLKYIVSSNSRSKVDPIPFLSLSLLSKLQPSFFCNEVVTSALLSILRRDVNVKARYCSNIHILAANMLTKAYKERTEWPDSFLRVYIEDAVNERFWADNEYCSPFINNISEAFKTITPPMHLLRFDGNATTSTTMAASQNHRDININIDDDSGDNSTQGIESTLTSSTETTDLVTNSICDVQKRFKDNIVEKFIVDAIKDQLNKRQQQDNYTKNFLKFLCTSSGIAEVRCLCISRLELWIHNGKLVKLAQQLLSYICFNIKGKCQKDHEVLGVLVKMRLKTKQLINHYMSCLKEIIRLQPDILSVILKLVVQNELSNTRNPNNMGMLATMFQTLPDQSASNLAEIYQEFLLQREDCLRTLRVFLRELVRMLRFDVNIVKFCKVFMTIRADLVTQIEQSDFRDRIFNSIVDIVCLCMFLTITPQAREACIALKATKDFKNSQILIKFYNQMSQMQLDVVSWMYETVPRLFKLQSTDYHQALHKLLLLDNPEQYSRADQWPSEPERGTLLRMISETPIHEETLLRIILIGITKDIPFTISETFDIILLAIKRVSAMKIPNCPAVQAIKFDIIDFLFSMSEYHHPENIVLPSHYEPPKLAIIVYYWKAWLILLMISAHNPSTFGAFCWDHYPTMKMLMEMCITNQMNNNASAKDELQILTIEKEHILQYEKYLAAHTSPQAVITEDNALLISQLMLMAPMGAARKIPTTVLDQLKFLNQTYKLGHLFCRCRKPDLLLDIIQRQGTTQSMPWLSDLVQNSEGDLNHLPVQCLCEFLLFNAHNINEENSRDAELVDFLRNLITDVNSNKQTVCEVLDYIFRRLSSTVKQSRVSALAGIKIMFKNYGEYDNDWLLKSIPEIPHFLDVRAFIIPQLRAACQVENNPELVMAYIQFITAHTLNDPVNEMLDHVIDMAQLIVERSTMFQHIVIAPEDGLNVEHEQRLQTLKCLFVMFNNYIIKLREYNEPYEWTEYPDLLMVQFDDSVQLPLHINIIHAFIILLTYSSSNMPESIPILDYWFPLGRPAPIAFLPNIPQEPVQLLPDWLKLKMIRSPVERLIEAALHELTPDQIVLFVQNFGTPVNSMSKLLALLDNAVLEQFDSVKNAILNKAYLAQLIEIQQARGAKNGHYTVQALELHSHAQTVPDLPKLPVQVLEQAQMPDFMPLVQRKPQPQPQPQLQLPMLSGSTSSSSNSSSSTSNSNIGNRICATTGSVITSIGSIVGGSVISSSSSSSSSNSNNNNNNKNNSSSDNNNRNLTDNLRDTTEVVHTVLKLPKLGDFNNYRYRHLIHQLLADKANASSTSPSSSQANVQAMSTLAIQNMVRDVDHAKTTCYESIIPNQHTCTLFRALLSGRQTPMECYETIEGIVSERLSNTQLGALSLHFESLCFMLNNSMQRQQTRITQHQVDALQQKTIIKNMLIGFNEAVLTDTSMTQYGNRAICHNGLFVDWLADTDPELLMNDALNKRFLFSNKSSEFRFYLLSLINHQTNWETIVRIADYLFQESHAHTDYSTVLNYFEALTNNPKLWKGRNRNDTKIDQPNTVFILKDSELKSFTEFILNEGVAELALANANADVSPTSNYDYKLCARMNLMFRMTEKDRGAMVKFVENVSNHNCSETLKLQTLQQLYLMYPSIKFMKLSQAGEQVYKLQTLKGCQADKVSSYLITCLGSLVTKKDFETLSSDTELLIRKLAASHPTLFLRQLSVFSSLIQGRAQNTLKALREEYHFHRFVQILRALELLQPMIFEDTYKQEFQTTLTCYFNFFKHHSCVKEAYQILIKFVQLLQSYININPTSALLFIEQYVGILMELAPRYSSMAILQQLVQAIALLQHKNVTMHELDDDDTKIDFEIDDSNDSVKAAPSNRTAPAAAAASSAAAETEVVEPATQSAASLDLGNRGALSLAISGSYNRLSSSSNISPHFLNLIKIIKQSTAEDVILWPLQEIEGLTSKRFSFLNELFDRLLDLIFSPSAQIRSIAFIMLIRHLKHNPGHAGINKCTLNAYIQCLRDENSSVASTAIDNLCEITLLLQEHASEILSVAFSLGLRSRLNTCTQIKRVLQTIMLQHGY